MNKLQFTFLGKLSAKEQTHFAKRLSFLIGGGVPLLDSLDILKKQTKSKIKQKMYSELVSDVSNGQFLSTSLARFKHIFGDFAINIIRVGESSGILSQNLQYLAEELKKKQVLRQKVLGALIYPIFITIATLGITSLLTLYIFPKIMPIFGSLHVALPATTRGLIFISIFLNHYGFYFLFFLLLFFSSFFFLRKKSERFRFFIDSLLVRLPFLGNLIIDYNMTSITRTLGLLLKSEVPVVEALTITAETSQNRVYRKELHIMAKKVIEGERISKHLENNIFFPELLVHMISIGEGTGNLSSTCLYLSEMYEHDLEDATKGLSSAIEPILMIIMGVLIGLIAISVITPIYEITQNLHS